MNLADPPFAIRPAHPADAPEVAGLLGELGFPAAVDVVERRLRALASQGEMVLVGVRGSDVLGFVTVHVTPVLHRPTPVGRMTALVVANRARRNGLGRMLVAAAERHVASAGCALIEVTSRRTRPDAHRFYESLGYEQTSHRFGKTLPTEG
jgi:ribosomal protein S18 acetylase RimI-like enzyme